MIVTVNKTYFGYLVKAFKDDEDTSPYPWRFEIYDPSTGSTKSYAGIPNKCETHKQALKRGWYRAKWMRDGTYENRYR